MIDRHALLGDLQDLLPTLEADLRERVREVPDLDRRLRDEYRAAREAGRTAQAYEEWREEPLTQVAVAWILGCVFVRFMEDNGLVETPRLSGAGERLKLARDHHTVFFQKHPSETDREYLLDVFRDVATLPAARELFDERHNPLWSIGLSGDGARRLLEFWQGIDPETGALVHDFADPEWNTRFLGDLYQDLSEAARKKYALLQTPEFVEEFILDRTLGPAIEEFGYREVRLIDVTCGSGHFLLGSFRRLFELWLRHEPGTNARELAQRALDGVYGVDLNPFAVAIARFRLLTAAVKACGVTRLKDAPGFRINLAVGDSLLHGNRWQVGTSRASSIATERPLFGRDRLQHVYASEDQVALNEILGRQYHAVVGNPPYITVRDRALNDAYRQNYGSCHMKYSLAVPFMERFFELALPGPVGSGFVGMITANSFMKREFGKKLIENFIPRWDLTHVLDTSGAYVPGHGTPTVILFGRNRPPVTTAVRAVMGIRGEPVTPDDPARGLVWSAVVGQVDQPGSSSDWVSVSDTPRSSFHQHPWSIGGGGAAELKEALEEGATRRLGELVNSIGFASFTGTDEAFVFDRATPPRKRIEAAVVRPFVYGEAVRDWAVGDDQVALVPYGEDFAPLPWQADTPWARHLWLYRTTLGGVLSFGGKTRLESGDDWWTWYRWVPEKYRTPLSITFAEVASHNHFVLDRGGKVFNRTAPVIKLREGASEEDHLGLLGVLNSSTACFWMKQVAHQKQMTGGDGVRVESRSKVPYQFSGTQLGELPLPAAAISGDLRRRFINIARAIDTGARQLADLSAQRAISEGLPGGASAIRTLWDGFLPRRELLRWKLILMQEELDFTTYVAFGLAGGELLDDDAPLHEVAVQPGDRPFCLLMGRNEDGFPVPSDFPSFWPTAVRGLWRARLEAVRADPQLRLVEDAHYKRRWIGRQGVFNRNRDVDDLATACEAWLLDRLENPAYWPTVEPQSCARLADRARADADFIQVAELLRGRADFDVAALVAELVEAEAVPFLSVLRYKDTGLRKRALWERTWDLQRQEDRGEAVGDIPVPPKYTSADFKNGGFWSLRGKLDVPKERFISYPGCERSADPTLVIGWAGWNHLQQAQALAGYYVAMKDNEGWSPDRLTPLLAGLQELLPWLEQWHNDLDPAYGMGMGEYFRRFLDEEIRSMDLTIDAVRAWKPSAATGKKRKGR